MSRLIIFLCLLFCYGYQICAEGFHAQVSSFKTQRPNPGKPTIVSFEWHDDINNIEIESNSNLIVKKEGFYFISYSGQIGALTTNAEGYMDVWFLLNSKPVANSNNRMYLSRNIPVSVLTTASLIHLKEKDSVSVAFSTSGPDIGLIGFPADKGPPVTSCNLIIFEINTK